MHSVFVLAEGPRFACATSQDDEETEEISIKIMDNMKAAVANQWPKPHEMPIYAGKPSMH